MPTTLERMLQQAAVDPDFRSESARFGVEQLPESVQEQDQQCFAGLNDSMQGPGRHTVFIMGTLCVDLPVDVTQGLGC